METAYYIIIAVFLISVAYLNYGVLKMLNECENDTEELIKNNPF